MKLTLEEAIKYYSELAEENEKDAKQFKRFRGTQDMISHCYECAKEHRQLAEWLKELKAYKKAYTEIDSKIESDYMGNNEYEMAVSDGYQGAINIIDRCIEEVKADDTNGCED